MISRISNEQSLVVSQLEKERANASKLKKELEDLWKNDTAAMYELSSVFIHRGSSPSFGHYFFYSRNLPTNPDQWFKYNDSSVTVVSKEEVFADTTGSTANPYMVRVRLSKCILRPMGLLHSLFSLAKVLKLSRLSIEWILLL